MQKLTYKYRRPLVLKSPGHTAASNCCWKSSPTQNSSTSTATRTRCSSRLPHDAQGRPWWTLQRPDCRTGGTDAQPCTRRRIAAFFDERPADPLRAASWTSPTTRSWPTRSARSATSIEGLHLPDFAVAEPAIQRYLATDPRATRRTGSASLPRPWKEAVARRLRRCFDEWGYPT